MYNEFALDLKVARRNAGLTQRDCAHLIDVNVSLVSLIENGRRVPTVTETCKLSLIYGKSFESLFSGIMRDARNDLFEQIVTIPDAPIGMRGSFNRQKTLESLAERLEEADSLDYDD